MLTALSFATSRVGFVAIETDRAGEADRFSMELLFATSRVGSVTFATDKAGEADRFSKELLFATSRVGSVANRAGASETDKFSLVLSFATPRVPVGMIVTDRAGEAGRCSLVVSFAGSLNCLVPSELSVAEAEDLQKKFKSCRFSYVTIITIPSIVTVPLRLPSIRRFI